MKKSFFDYIGNVFRENTKESFGRVIGAVFLLGSFGVGLADGIASLRRGDSALDAALQLALTGWSIFTSSKYLQIKGDKAKADAAAAAGTAPEEEPA
jgi:hypothetical protein